ncbi:MAG TPA: hypothetical protein VM115_12635 [Vicinamibacterales bacterium]|nr:hypothetical protein [Vicinamibacterales bacterium]
MGNALLILALAFAFPNEQGTSLLATAEIGKPEIMRAALCSGGQQLSVQFERKQPEGAKATGRQAPHNFSQTAGAVFRIVRGKVAADATCVLADESFLAGATVLPLKRPPQTARCSKALYPQFQADKDRPIVACWPIADGGPGVQVAILEFSRRLTRALASLVVIDGDRRTYIDYPADFKGPGESLWRVDDGGEIHAEGFEVVFLLKRGATYVLAIDWGGAEGNALSVHTADGGGQFKEVLTDSWYRSPM